jgi:hypothetical protein
MNENIVEVVADFVDTFLDILDKARIDNYSVHLLSNGLVAAVAVVVVIYERKMMSMMRHYKDDRL